MNWKLYATSLRKSEGIFDRENIRQKIQDIEAKMSENGFWDKTVNQGVLLQDYKKHKNLLEEYESLAHRSRDVQELSGLYDPEDPEYRELAGDVRSLAQAVGDLDIRLLFKDQEDRAGAIIAIHSGAGGTESQDWVEMLFRLYTRFCERKGFEIKVIDSLEGDEAGLKHITYLAQGEYAYGYLKSERGVHRLIRISPFDSNKRRHTTFALVEVTPDLDDEIQVDMNPQDLRIETYRSGGAGGQHVNTTDSAVRIIHLPTGIMAQCQNERSQHQNKAVALRILRARLYERQKSEQEERIQEQKGEHKDIAWGSQIRTYVFHPYNMVKDHRTNHETGNVQRVMDGEIEEFVERYLRQERIL
ncbi:MAG TPA: peptide chain release factor 2 [Atribacteraceae bacterium]|nr:peptide chain release factor 2 [Atribacteraceae bacterium]